MTITIVDVKNCKYASEDKTRMNCEAKFTGLDDNSLNNTWLPFTASETDTEQHGKDIIANAKKGDYGSITDFAHPSLDEELLRIRGIRNLSLSDCDWTVASDTALSTSKVNEWKTYRQKLRDITSGLDTAEKARNVTWPTKPS
tara:strand:- start:262 stop:690 length:429 start_codon:yes stop_codon:yes gene_type:complete